MPPTVHSCPLTDLTARPWLCAAQAGLRIERLARARAAESYLEVQSRRQADEDAGKRAARMRLAAYSRKVRGAHMDCPHLA